VRVAFEVQDGVDDVFEHARPGERAFLGHVPHQHDGGARALGGARQLGGALAHLRHRAGGRGQLVAVDRLDRVDHADGGLFVRQRGQYLFELNFRQYPHTRLTQPQSA